jgi:transcriptional regulator with XRE-family HTH domain
MSAWSLLREARAEAGLSQRGLADRAGVAQSEIARIENGRQEPSYARMLHLLRSAGFDLRTELVPHDEHDAELIRGVLSVSPEERLDSLEEYADFFASAFEPDRGARP